MAEMTPALYLQGWSQPVKDRPANQAGLQADTQKHMQVST